MVETFGPDERCLASAPSDSYARASSATKRLIGRCIAMVWLATIFTGALAQNQLTARADAVRSALTSAPDSLDEDRADFLRRLLLASLERRQDLERALSEASRTREHFDRKSPLPDGLLAWDDLRRDLQQLDATLKAGERRRAILQQERDVAAMQLASLVATQRSLSDAGAPAARVELAALESELAESTIAEIDLMLRLLGNQQDAARRQRRVLAQRLGNAFERDAVKPSPGDEEAIDQRLRRRTAELNTRMARAAAERAQVRDRLRRTPVQAAEAELLKERLTNADIDMELSREALTGVATERAIWQVALRFHRDGDAAALVEARNQGPLLLGRLQRRHDFLSVLADQTAARLGVLSAELTQASSAPDAAARKALLEVLQQRQQMVQAAIQDGRELSAFIERMRSEFDERVSMSGWKDRAWIGVAAMRSWLDRAWNFELFTVDQAIEVEGRKTAIQRGVTVGKLIKAPLLLVCGLFLAFRSTAWVERWLKGRPGTEEGSARLLRRWALALLIAACVLGSLGLAGIPLAAFAFIGGAVAIGIGFGMQTLFKNLISGVLLLIERPFRLGDVIEVGSLRGTVVDIDLRTSAVRDSDGAETLIPNSVLIEEKVRNITFRSRTSRQKLAVVVEATSDPRVVADAMRTAAARHGQLSESPVPMVMLDEFVENGLRFVLHYWIELVPGVEHSRIASDLRLMVLGAFEESGIRLPEPRA
jgi:small-conductance mechanosensitive channel